MSLTYHNYVCECGCGELVLPGSRFVHGHYLNINNPSYRKDVQEKHRLNKLGKTLKELGHTPDCTCGPCKASRGECKGENCYWFGKTMSEEQKENLRKPHKGNSDWARGKTLIELYGYEKANKIKELNKISHLGLKHSEISRNKNQEIAKQQWQDPEFQEKQKLAQNVFPNKAEICLNRIIEELFPNQFKYVGDFSFFVAGKSPDFIHTSKKLIIELFGDYWHSEQKTGIPNEQHEYERIQLFESEGYKTLIIWEHELKNVNKLKSRILNFVERF